MSEENTPIETPETETSAAPNAEQGSQSEVKKTETTGKKEQHGSRRGENTRDGNRDGQDRKKRSRNRRGKRRSDTEGSELVEEVLDVARVTRVVKGGRRLRFRATVLIGDRNGRVGLGTGKSVEVAAAVKKGVAAAKKAMITVPIQNGTIPHELRWKHKSARILLMPAKEGTGIIAGGAVRKVADLAGIENILGKSYGTNNKLVNAQAMMEALQAFRGEKIGSEG